MSSTYFVHGNMTVPETPGGANIGSPGPLEQVGGIPWTDVVGLRQGRGATFRGKRNDQLVWFHIPFPTPSIVNDVRCRLSRLDVLFDIDVGSEATVDEIHLWGKVSNDWYAERHLDLRSGWSHTWTSPGDLLGVIGISVGVDFREDADILFRGAQLTLA